MMSVTKFLVYCNGITWFHKSVDAEGSPVTCATASRVFFVKVTKDCVYFPGDLKGGGGYWSGTYRAYSHGQWL
jgi:hypothetical protein